MALCLALLPPVCAQESALPRLPRGFDLALDVLWEFGTVVSGGLEQRSSTRHLIALTGTVDLAEAFGRPGAGSLHGIFVSSPPSPAGTFDAGDLQVVSNIQSERSLDHLLEAWYARDLGAGVDLEIGKIDANRRFAAPECATAFTHSSAGFSPTILGMPSYPDSGTGLTLFLERDAAPNTRWGLSYGLFDGALAADGVRTGRRGLADPFEERHFDSLFHIAQADLRFDASDGTERARVALGGWFHTGPFERRDGGSETGSGGTFAIAEWTPPGLDGWTVFAQVGTAERAVTSIAGHHALGIVGTVDGFGGPRDEAGLYWSQIDVPRDVAPSNETAIDLFYRARINENVFVQPEAMWVEDPAGRTDIGDATWLLVRVGLSI